MRPLPFLLIALAASAALPAGAAPFQDGSGDALAADPADHWLTVPTADVVLGTAAGQEPVPIDGRLGWFVHESVVGEPTLHLGDDEVPGTFEEEVLGDYAWIWFTPDDLLIPLAQYTFEFGVGGQRSAIFRTGANDLGHLDLDAPLAASLTAVWYPGSPPFLSVQAVAIGDASDPGSSRLSVVRFSMDGELAAVVPMGLERRATGWLSADQLPGSVAPDAACVSVVHENGLGDAGDATEVCGDVEVAEGPGIPGGCACDQGAPSPGAVAEWAFLGLLGAALRRRARG